MQITQKNFYKKFLGRAGEVKAVELLKKKGYKILEKNYKNFVGEIDVIAKDNDEIVFIEVKTRTNDEFGRPSEAVNLKKQEKYYKIATEYLRRNNLEGMPCRFDVVEIENGQINHILNAFGM